MTAHVRAKRLLEDQSHIPEMIARDSPLQETLETLARRLQQWSGAMSAVILLDPRAPLVISPPGSLEPLAEGMQRMLAEGDERVTPVAVARAAAAAALRLTRFPFLVAPLGLIAWFVSLDAAPLLFGQDVSAGERALVSAAVGAALLAGGLALDRRALRSHAFWAHLFGLLTVSTVCYAAAEHGEAGWALFGMPGLAAIVASVALDRRTSSVFGGLLVAAWTSHLAYEVFGRTLPFPVVLAAIGVGIVLLGVGLARHQDRLHAQLAGCVGAGR